MEGPILYCDNKSTIKIAHNPIQHHRTKHVEVDQHSTMEKLDRGQLSNVLTKGLTSHPFQELTSMLGMENIYSPTWEVVLKIVNIISIFV